MGLTEPELLELDELLDLLTSNLDKKMALLEAHKRSLEDAKEKATRMKNEVLPRINDNKNLSEIEEAGSEFYFMMSCLTNAEINFVGSWESVDEQANLEMDQIEAKYEESPNA